MLRWPPTHRTSGLTDADLLVHEVALITPRLLASAPSYKEVQGHHTSPEGAGRLFSIAKPKLAVYAHLVLPAAPKAGIAAPTADDVIAATRSTCSGPPLLGSDLMGFRIAAEGVSVIRT